MSIFQAVLILWCDEILVASKALLRFILDYSVSQLSNTVRAFISNAVMPFAMKAMQPLSH